VCRFWGSFAASLMLVMLTAGPASAADGHTSTNMRNCGLYSMYTILQWFNAGADPKSIIKKEYLSSAHGSTLADLAQAAQDNGLHAVAVKNLSLNSLRSCPFPVICSVRKDVTEEPFDHYLVVLPTDSGERVAYDALDNVSIPLNQLRAGIWNGYGLIVSPRPFSMARLLWRDYVPYALFFAGLFLARAWIARKRKSLPQAHARPGYAALARDTLIILAMALFAALAWDTSSAAGSMLSMGENVLNMQERNLGSFLEQVDAEEISRAIASKTVIVDARYARDYALGHIPGAINVSMSDDDTVYQDVFKDVAVNEPIIVYCQSSGCPYAGNVAKKLWRRGYTNVKYYKNGWLDWHDAHGGESERKP